MCKKCIISLIILAGIVSLGWIAHTINLIDIMKRLHGG